MEKKAAITHSYFASANSFLGFKSYFKEVFNSKNFERIFVLKGGPGTGKSSFMKRVLKLAGELSLRCEEYHCSSDPDSLDGVIIYGEKSKVAILDGTAPHERDATIPGAVDELINLGEAWHEGGLIEMRKAIENLNEKKTKAYQDAYDELRICCEFEKKLKAEIKKQINYFEFNTIADEIFSRLSRDLKLRWGETEVKLLSSFSKNGYTTDFSYEKFNKAFYVTGSLFARYTLITLLAKRFKESGYGATLVPSPLDPEVYEAIIFGNSDTVISVFDGGDEIADAERCINSDDYLEKSVKYLSDSIKMHMEFAKEHLTLASKYHFELEDIYTPLMDFGIIDEIFEKVSVKIKNIFAT